MKEQVIIPNSVWVQFKSEMAEAWLGDVMEYKDAYVHDADGNGTDEFTEEGQDWFMKLYDSVEETLLHCGMIDEMQVEKCPDPEPEIVRAGSELFSPCFVLTFDGDCAELHSLESMAEKYPAAFDKGASCEGWEELFACLFPDDFERIEGTDAFTLFSWCAADDFCIGKPYTNNAFGVPARGITIQRVL
jgi:hypothetical protein